MPAGASRLLLLPDPGVLLTHAGNSQVMRLSSHALLQEAGVDLPSLMREEGFYTTRRRLSAPLKRRTKDTFGTAAPLELPTDQELEISTDE